MSAVRSLSLALLALACAAPPPEPPGEPAVVALEVMRGLDAAPAASEARVVALIDATRSMSLRDPAGVVYLDAARRSAQRWLRDLPAATAVELRSVGGERGMHCASGARAVVAGPQSASDVVLQGAIERLVPVGEGSLAEALDDVAEAAPLTPAATPLRVVAWSALEDGCGASLCSAAAALQ
ncbi:MAG TPA: hypothetical protein VNF72_01075, partial [Myxococcota bacterium]|nr:hypothetical protein [Myxococcota bacterium]